MARRAAPRISATEAPGSAQFQASPVHLQRDTERSLRGAALPYDSIQVGLSRHIIVEYVGQRVTGIEDITPRVRTMYELLQSGQSEKAGRQLPPEKVYPIRPDLATRLLIRTWPRAAAGPPRRFLVSLGLLSSGPAR